MSVNLDHLADLIASCQLLDITVSSIVADKVRINVWTQCATARTDAERLAANYGKTLVEDKGRRRNGSTVWSADLITVDKVARVTVNAASFDFHEDWVDPYAEATP